MSLWSRVTNPVDDEVKIPIHGFTASFDEWEAGAYSRQKVVDMWAITAQEETQLDILKAEYSRAASKGEFKIVFKNCAYLAELDKDYQFADEALVRLQLVP